MSLFQMLLADSSPFELFWIIGDSIADGRGESVPTVPGNTLFLWNGSGITEITTQSVANETSGGPYGSIWQNFSKEYKRVFKKRVVIVNSASGGSEFYPNGDNNNWSTSGTLYAAGLTQVQAAQTFLGGITINVIVCLGVNDIRGAQTASNITNAAESLRNRINSDLSTPEIYWIVPGRTDTVFNSDKCQQVRRTVVNLGLDSNGHIVSCLLPFENWGLYLADNLHLAQAGNDICGEQIVRYMSNTGYAKHTRSIIACFKDDITSAKKSAIDTFVGFFAAFTGTVDGFYCFVGSSRENIMIDWGLVCAPLDLGSTASGTFVANDCLSMDGASQYLSSEVLVTSTTRSSNTDFVEFVKTGTVGEASGTSAFLFGKSDASKSSRIYQGSSLLHAQCFDATDNTYSEAKFADDSVYAIARNGTNKMMKKDGSNVISVTQATTGGITGVASYIGTNNANGTPAAQCIQSEYKCWGLFQLSDITWSSFVTELNTLITAMEA